MFVVDTNVLSELGSPDPDPNAIGWLRRRDGDLLLPASLPLVDPFDPAPEGGATR